MTRLYCLLAREAETGVIFRRGPSRQVLLLHWDLKTHRFTPGQWFNGRIYERKSDLSPDGTRLVYFAAKQRLGMRTWIAVSTPPYLTAHVLWPGSDTWNRISLFESNDRLTIDADIAPADGFVISRRLQVMQRRGPGHFFKMDNHEQLVRDGWTVSHGEPVFNPRVEWGPVEYRKALERSTVELVMSKTPYWMPGVHLSYIVVDDVDLIVDLQAEWADVRGTDVYYTQGGKLFRLPFARHGGRLVAGCALELADFNDLTFRAVLPPLEALHW